MKPGITPNLWFDKEAEEAANFYVSVFPNSKVGNIARYPETGREITGGEPGSVMTVDFTVNGQNLIGINGGPAFKFNEAISLMVTCDTQKEVDELWEKLTADGGAESQCGWLKDKYGVSWQIIPAGMGELFNDPDRSKAERAMGAMLKMKKLDIDELRKAADGPTA
jgi:predicted 3-demethylubiquinone-9 3-methyltransferase (glyoxalase superfamily)